MRLELPRLRVVILVTMIVVTLGTVGWWVFGPSGVAVELTQRSWRMEIIVERLRSESGSDWCDELPEGAFDISRRTIADPTGKRAEPGEHCRYSTLAWRRSWIAKTEGGPDDRPDWPRPPLRVAPPGQPGSERLGKREAYFEIELRDWENHAWVCRLDPEHWKQLRVGMRFRMPVDRFGTANCPGLYPSRF